ncbi:MAG: hypothetical protein J6C41_00235, partial [Oscillospiraceae bacterium]|nr:hypothetical protein [Oscillospiraceae bacterium]
MTLHKIAVVLNMTRSVQLKSYHSALLNHASWAVRHSDKLPEKAWISPAFHQNPLKSTKDSRRILVHPEKIPILFRC